MILQFLKGLVSNAPKTNYRELLQHGALIVDVRTPAEFKQGHIPNAVNIPLDRLGSQLHRLKARNVPVITCCQSGMRSNSATRTLNAAGIRSFNGGAWHSLQQLIA